MSRHVWIVFHSSMSDTDIVGLADDAERGKLIAEAAYKQWYSRGEQRLRTNRLGEWTMNEYTSDPDDPSHWYADVKEIVKHQGGSTELDYARYIVERYEVADKLSLSEYLQASDN